MEGGEVILDPKTGKEVGRTPTSRSLVLWALKSDSLADLLGVQLAPLTDAMRAQMNLTDGTGVYVSKLRADGPCAKAGLKIYDVLVAVGDRAIKAPEDFTKHLRAAGEETVTLKLIRGGKTVRIPVRPRPVRAAGGPRFVAPSRAAPHDRRAASLAAQASNTAPRLTLPASP